MVSGQAVWISNVGVQTINIKTFPSSPPPQNFYMRIGKKARISQQIVSPNDSLFLGRIHHFFNPISVKSDFLIVWLYFIVKYKTMKFRLANNQDNRRRYNQSLIGQFLFTN